MAMRRYGCASVEPVGKIFGCLLVESYFCVFFIFYNYVISSFFILSGRSKRALIARGSQGFFLEG